MTNVCSDLQIYANLTRSPGTEPQEFSKGGGGGMSHLPFLSSSPLPVELVISAP